VASGLGDAYRGGFSWKKSAQPALGPNEDSKVATSFSYMLQIFRLQGFYHITHKVTTIAPITGTILASQFDELDHRTAAPVADEEAALPVADIVPVPAPVAVELGLVPEETL
jgi:hypothetical protein